MFDVSWTDPARETVGQRKNRKDQQANNLSRVSSVRSSKSNETSQSNIRPSLLNLFGSSGSSKKTIKRTGSHSKLAALRNEDNPKTSRRISSYTITSDISNHDFPSVSRVPSQRFFNPASYHSDAEQSSSSEVSESVFSGWTGRSNATDSTWSSVIESPNNPGKLVQSLSASSFVTQSTEITVSPRESVRADEQVATVVSISAAGTMPIEIRDSQRKSPHPPSTFNFPIPRSQRPRPESFVLPPSPTPKAKRIESSSPSSGWPIAIRNRNSDSWRPPDTWECPIEEQESSSISPVRIGPPLIPLRDSRREAVSQVELSHLQRSIRRMESASPKIILERLKEEWLEVADASVYRELELEKQLWMLTALRGLKKRTSKEVLNQAKGMKGSAPTSAIKVLSLYENHASSSFLSALNPLPTIHHLSTSPLSPNSYPNIHPLCIPLPTAQLPYASNLFASIHAFSLPAFLPASSVPTLLKECHRTLTSAAKNVSSSSPTSPVSFSSASTATIVPLKRKPVTAAGTIHLTVLDPAPLPDTLGPHLRSWLDTHLLLNLERQFRCINPGRLFPIWLADAGLRAEGSTIINIKFLACIAKKKKGAQADEGVEVDAGVKLELKSVVGRMLWKEMWGSFVEGDKWWWEDEDIVNECLEKATSWEYAVIQGVKEG